jgi:hypothetical protein
MTLPENSNLSTFAHRLIGIAILFAASCNLHAQAAAQSSAMAKPDAQNTEEVPRVPGLSSLFRGFNAGLSYSGVHSSSVSWYQELTPAVSYAFSERYSADISLPVYLHRLVPNNAVSFQSPQRLLLDKAGTGDTLMGFHASFSPRAWQDTASFSLTAPTGNRSEGLGTGKVTYDFDNRVERYIHQSALLLDTGFGDSSSVVNTLLTQDYSSLGKLAHFQTGAIIWISRRYSIQSVAYEQLPLGSQTVYLSKAEDEGRGAAPFSNFPNNNVVINSSASEDNGFTTSTNLPLTPHLILSGYYDRSLRQHLDTVSVGMTFVLRPIPLAKRISLIDRALREAASVNY